MELVKLSSYEFNEFASTTKQESFYQSLEYARFLEEMVLNMILLV